MGQYVGWLWSPWDEDSLKDCECWILDAKEFVPALNPFELWLQMPSGVRNMPYGAEFMSIPSSLPAWRFKDGFCYLGRIKFSEKERELREQGLRQKMAPWIEDFEAEWRGKYAARQENGFKQLKKVDVKQLNTVEMRDHFQDCLRYYQQNWAVHFICHYAAFAIYDVFESMCREFLGLDEYNPKFQAVMAGFDNRIFQVDAQLHRLASKAIELRLDNVFGTTSSEELQTALGESDAGRKWLAEFYPFLDENGWRTTRTLDVSTPTWVEKPSLALSQIKTAVAHGGISHLDQVRKRLSKQREEVEKEFISRVPSGKKELFKKLMEVSQWSGRYSEEHIFYCEHMCNSIMRRVTVELGKRLTQKGFIEDPEDIYFLFPDEIIDRFIEGCLNKYSPRKLVQIRKEQWQENLKAQPVFCLGDPSKIGEVCTDEMMLRHSIAAKQVERPELKANLYGSNATGGVAEGPARVIFSVLEFEKVQPGEILVTVTTSPIWTPLFSIIKGLVTDAGGALTHAIIVGREFGLPVVAGTMQGTSMLKTGQRIRVDADNCCVYIL